MKLDPAGVEKAAEAMFNEWSKHESLNGLVTAAITVYFDHLKSEGLMREATGKIWREDDWSATTGKIRDWFPALIIKQEE